MKRVGFPGRGGRPGKVSRPSRAGLIEARLPRGGSHPRRPVSRPSRAGLIEARTRRRTACCVRRRFPALRGRASLKLLGDARTVLPILQVSRPSRAGLIEAVGCSRETIAVSAVSRPSRAGLIEARGGNGRGGPTLRWFPALRGRASLKHHRLGPVVVHRDRFPALRGRASLKRAAGRARPPAGDRVSRPSRAGLIEASGGAGRAGAAEAGFPPFAGGPH